MNGHFDRIMKVAERPPVAMVKGAGSWLWDRDGKRYLDFVQGWAVNCLGHSPPVVLEALTAQAAQLINCSPAYYNEPMAKLADLLAEASGLDQVFLCPSGAEANEGAIKLARKWGARHRNGAYEIVTMHGGFHGRTLATMAASGKAGWDELFEPKVPGVRKVPLGDLDAVAKAISARTVAAMIQPSPGEAGRIVATAGCAVVAAVTQKGFLQTVVATGLYLAHRLRAIARELGDGEVRGRGLLVALEIRGRDAKKVAAAALDHGLLINAPRPDALRFMPALTVTRSEIDEMIARLKASLGSRPARRRSAFSDPARPGARASGGRPRRRSAR